MHIYVLLYVSSEGEEEGASVCVLLCVGGGAERGRCVCICVCVSSEEGREGGGKGMSLYSVCCCMLVTFSF